MWSGDVSIPSVSAIAALLLSAVCNSQLGARDKTAGEWSSVALVIYTDLVVMENK